ncbi:uncharacterized protein LOC143492646 [Brachyhypopomus gauderio]|uniref:uncharacterized protein LOC143492646 n=1 Tax=Brachyhypopomus gauderio TaxID=698409 RepID=UPI004041CE60
MLGEAFLHVLKHRQEHADPVELSSPSHTFPHTHSLTHAPSHTPSHTPSHAAAHAANITPLSSRSALVPRAVRVENSGKACRPEGLEQPGTRLISVPSMALTIPSCIVEDHMGLQLYQSWCPSFCKAYPDLQLAGGTLGPYPPLSPQCLSPLLLSQDMGSLEALEEPGQRVEAEPKPDEVYLEVEGMQSPGWEQRLTSSMLNGYLETQLLEVYRQHMQDSLARGSSLSSGAVPPLVPTNSSMPDGQAGPQGDGQESGSAHNSVRYLSTCSAPCTSHFSSPVLRISYPQEPNT